jgi:hypothetical protein
MEYTAGEAEIASESRGINIPGAAAMTDAKRLSIMVSLIATILKVMLEEY